MVVVDDSSFQLIILFFFGNNIINLFSMHYFLLFQWMYYILLSISKPRTVFGVLLSKPLLFRLILVLCNFMVFSRSSSGWWFGHCIYAKKQRHVWWISHCWLDNFAKGFQFVHVSLSLRWVRVHGNKHHDQDITFFVCWSS